MAEQKESSVLFSLKELMSLEEDRIKQEEDERKRKEQAEQQARLDAERRARETEEQRIAAEQEKQRQEAQRSREEQARLEAIRQAEVEKARLDAEQQARLRAMQQQQDHERQLAAISQDEGKKKLTYIAVAIGAVLVFGGIGGGYAFYSSAQEAKRIQALKDEEIRQKEAQVNKLMADLKAQNDAMAAAQAEAASAKTDAERAAAQAKLLKAQEDAKRTQANIAAVRNRPGAAGGGGGGAPRPACTCQAGDPLCSCL
jgi:colicin import membrane protein